MSWKLSKCHRRSAVRAFLTASLITATSVLLPLMDLNGEPPKAGTARKGRVQIRFSDIPDPTNESTPKAQEQKAQKQEFPATKIDSKVAQRSGAAINVATNEERNQVIAPDWNDPWAVFFVSGMQYGYMEPCGCTGLENQKGGLMRRDSLLASLKGRGWNIVPVDVGNQVRDSLKQNNIKFEWTGKALEMMGYAATTFGEYDLNMYAETLVYQLINTTPDADGKSNPLYLSANVSVFPEMDTQYKVIKIGKKRIAITGVIGDENAKKVQENQQEEGVKISPAIASLKRVAQKIRNEKCDFHVLLANASLEESRKIAKEVPDFQLIVTSGGFGEPTYRPELIEGTKSQMIQVGAKGMYAGIVGLFEGEELRYQRIALSSQFEDSPRMSELFGKYQDQLKAEGFKGLGLKPQSHPTGREFAGSEKCGECHTTAFDIWKATPHAHATDSIVQPPERSLPRHFDPECLSCHTTGWNPQKYFYYKTGFESLETTPHMVANGCENCHGPGKNHADAESGDIEATKAMLIKLREEMQLPLEKARDKCLECHDQDNSPEFQKENAFEQYWEKVKHYGKD